MPKEWGGNDHFDNFRIVCQDCNSLRARAGHCLGALACVVAVAQSMRIKPLHVINRWRLPQPIPPGFDMLNFTKHRVSDEWKRKE